MREPSQPGEPRPGPRRSPSRAPSWRRLQAMLPYRRGARRRDRAPPRARRSRRPARPRGTRRRRALAAGSASGTGAPCDPRRARLASCRAAAGVRSDDRGDVLEGHARTCRAARTPVAPAGARVSSTTSSASPTESASTASCSGSAASRVTIGSGTATSSGIFRRDLRDRSMSRHTRATTVVSQPPRFSTCRRRSG